ncbi:MAG: sigma 54-interacting transcriptional regulator [Candidatus Omnitrophota bacterium]
MPETSKQNPSDSVHSDQKCKWIVPPGLHKEVNDFVHLYELLYSSQKHNLSNRKPLMIIGDSGVGKSLFTDIFEKLYRLDYPSSKVKTFNCAAFQKDLILAELFGYKKGAFTGAIKDKVGLLKTADGGLVILEEIGELTEPDQAKLLTFLENGGRYYPVGSTKEERNVLAL